MPPTTTEWRLISSGEFISAYQAAYEDVLSKCSTVYATSFLIPADRKWYRNLMVSKIIKCQLEAMDANSQPCEDGLDEILTFV